MPRYAFPIGQNDFWKVVKSKVPLPLVRAYRALRPKPYKTDAPIPNTLFEDVRQFYFKIWHDCAVMHLFSVDSVEPEYTSVLDIGCGTGLVAPLINHRNPRCYYTGIDANEVAIEVAKRTLESATFVSGDFEVMNLQGQRYDLVLCSSVLEHKKSYEPLIKKLVDVARRRVVLGFYRGLLAGDVDEIQPVKTSSFWEPKYGIGTRDWDFSYLNTYSESRLAVWLEMKFQDWEIEIRHLNNPVLREFPSPAMVRLTRRSLRNDK